MRTLYFECNMGAAGDMLMLSLLELHDDPDDFIKRLNNIGIPRVKISRNTVTKCGILGTGVSVLIDGEEEGEHTHEHRHSHLEDIRAVIGALSVSDKIKSDALEVYRLIAEAESRAHGKAVEQIHFHEVGALDAVTDIVGVCMLIDEIKPDRIIASKVHVGSGQVKCAHGILPVPAPATAHILCGVPTYGGTVDGELCTPTGAALLKYFVSEFDSENNMTVENIGYGMGKRRFFDKEGNEILSAVRAMLGSDENKKDEIVMLSCNVDDMTGEQMGFATEQIMACGALDVFTAPVYMKKNRPGILLTVICADEDKKRMAELIFKYTTTIGIRESAMSRYVLDRSEKMLDTDYGAVKAKYSEGYGVSRTKAEYEDLKKIALENGISISDIQFK